MDYRLASLRIKKEKASVVPGRLGSLQVIGAGFGRTGTTSLQAALLILGFGPCYKTLGRPFDSWKWQQALNGKLEDWDRIFHGYHSTLDWPSTAFYAELAAAYPQAKVILTVRDPDRWYDSMVKTLYEWHRWVASPAYNLTRIFRTWHLAGRVQEEIVWKRTFGDQFENRERTIGIFKSHIDEVKARIPADRLLVYEVKQGWEPLCAFLNVPVPQGIPFPHLNDASTFRGGMNRRTAGLATALSLVLIGIVTIMRLRAH